MAKVLTQLGVENQKPDPNKRIEVPDGALPGFYLLVQPSGRKSWAVRYRFDGKPKKLTIGPYPLFDLGKARELARATLRVASEGRDPAEGKIPVKKTGDGKRNRFGAVAAEYIRRHAKAHHKTWAETERLLTKADLAAWKDKEIASITKRDVLDLVDAVVERGSPVQANRLITRLKPFFSWAVERGIIEISPIATLKPPSAETSRDRVLADAELLAIWKAAGEIGYPFGSAVRLLILTGQRRSEVLGARWSEIYIPTPAPLLRGTAAQWTIPKERSKTNVAHVVPLSAMAVAVLDSLPRIAPPIDPGSGVHDEARLLFTTNGATPFSGVTKVLARLNTAATKHMPKGENLGSWRLHDLRRTFASGCARLGIPVHVVEKALNHTSGTFGGIVGVYQRHNYERERRDAMTAWAGHVASLNGGKAKNVEAVKRK